jgi:60S ribosomal subunit assembly/export protein LOC1
MATILAMVQADKEGQIESKMIKARQMEEIREARRVEAEVKDAERKTRLDETKDGLRKKRKRTKPTSDPDVDGIADAVSAGTNSKPKKKKVSFA